ncbi:MAG: DsbA family oxidoreductase [Bacteroidetes bacterium]|nr:DsbA family oxidoreductase [Bacteroidota bacterium]
MRVEIWSDVLCPFCYIGKRKFENALQQFKQKDSVIVEWKSYQLDPEFVSGDAKSYVDYLATRKGFSLQQVNQMFGNVTEMAQSVGLNYRFDNAIVANSHKAHQLTHLAKKHRKESEIEEALFSAHFIEGKDIGNEDILIAIAKSSGIDEQEAKTALQSNLYANDVAKDIEEATKLGVQGVPFFVFNRTYAVSGAQDSNVFLKTLEKVATELK